MRLDKDLHELVVNSPTGDVSAIESQGKVCDVSYLRPRPGRLSTLDLAEQALQVQAETVRERR